MRDKKRIKIVTKKLADLWEMYPDLRFVQLLSLLEFPKGIGTDPFFWEDDVIERAIDVAIKKANGLF